MPRDILDSHRSSFATSVAHASASEQAGQAEFEQRLDDERRAASQVIAASVSALPQAALANSLPEEGGVRKPNRRRYRDTNELHGTQRQPGGIGDSGARVLMQSPIPQVGASEREAQPVRLGDEPEYTPAPHPGGQRGAASRVPAADLPPYSDNTATVSALPKPQVLANGLPDAGELRPTKRRALNNRQQHAATERQPSEVGYSGARVPMQSSTHQVGTSERDARLVTRGDPQALQTRLRGLLPHEEELLQLSDTARLQGTYRRVASVDVTPPTDDPSTWGDWLTLGSSDGHGYTPAPHHGVGGSMPSEVQSDPATFVHEGQDKSAALYFADATEIEVLKTAMRLAGFSEKTMFGKVNALLGFGRWLFKVGRSAFAARLDTPFLEQDLKDYASTGRSSTHVAGALNTMKTLKNYGTL